MRTRDVRCPVADWSLIASMSRPRPPKPAHQAAAGTDDARAPRPVDWCSMAANPSGPPACSKLSRSSLTGGPAGTPAADSSGIPCRGSNPLMSHNGSRMLRAVSGQVLDLGGQLSASTTGVNNAARLQEEHRRFGIGARAVLDTARHDEEFPRPQHDVAIAQLDGELPVQDQEELIGVGVLVPGELALNLHDPDVVVVDPGNFLRRPVLSETRQHGVDVHRVHESIVTRST